MLKPPRKRAARRAAWFRKKARQLGLLRARRKPRDIYHAPAITKHQLLRESEDT